MEQSNQHSPRVDDEMESDQKSTLQGKPVDSRTEEQRRDEGVGPRAGQPSAAAQPPGRQQGTSEGLTPLEVDLRSELASYVADVTFPARRSEIINSVREQNAPAP